ncbi:hypothetical protein FZI85_09440 [Mycobacterium sp. CBMA293]|uniref:hypothetical protein n=1 Tax=unclassified Mycolicibacterium TaxID=2636767 RepID=UPI00132ABC51|nr:MULTISPECIES: hypothetical protein [unclassified Mycolicibacterium]MUL46187.1 hypothetical protein [Mycolicibacterium sp. CBMA 360]MUL94122.1 hypothetical protein [Mycolicibacterium sp. CBMA 230]MUM32529.1 hypothetical protein [Mycolicibacterium sp. CBMA 361]MUL58764.1 hypothetical protein [Mycolicibacterium sp. CBMA 335]MUL64894.1 hypothetical protein [Mycolicibacterium sp. CBMA 234]
MNRLTAACAGALLTATALMSPVTAAAAVNSADAFVPVDDGTKIQIHVTANCAGTTCTFNTATNLVVGGNPVPLPPGTWARQNITLRSSNRNVYQDVSYSAPSGSAPVNRGSWNGPVNSRQLKSENSALVSVTFNGGGTFEEFAVDGTSQTLDVRTGQPNTQANFIACADIQVTYPGVNLTTPTACATTHY